MARASRHHLLTTAVILTLALGGCGDNMLKGDGNDAAGNEEAPAPPDGLSTDALVGSPSVGGTSSATGKILTLADGPDVCFREIAKKFGADVKVSEITSFFGGGEGLDTVMTYPRGQMTSCSVSFQSPNDPRKLLRASFDNRTGAFGEPTPVEITVMGGNAADFRLADYVIPLSRVDAAALTGIMKAQDKRLKSVYGDYAWTGVRLSSPGAFSNTHTLRLDLDGRLAANDIKESGYASVSIDGKRITADHLMP